MEPGRKQAAAPALTAQDLLAGGTLVHRVEVPLEVVRPRSEPSAANEPGFVCLRPLTVGTLTLISRAAREDPSLVPLLMIKEALVEPALSLDQVRLMHVGLVHFLIGEINQVSGLSPDGDAYDRALGSPAARAHLLLAKHFGWTPEQVSQLTPGQVMVYLAGIEKLLALDESSRSQG